MQSTVRRSSEHKQTEHPMDVKTNTVCYYHECCLQARGFLALPVISRVRLSYALLAKTGPSHYETFAQSISCNMYKAPHE